MHLALRTRINLWYSAVLFVLLVLSASLLFITMRNAAEKKLDAALWLIGSTEAEGISTRMRDRELSDPDGMTVRDIDTANLSGYEIFRLQRYVTVIDHDLRVADYSVNLDSQPIPFDRQTAARAMNGQVSFDTVTVPGVGGLRIIYVPILREGIEPVVAIVGVPTDFVGGELKGLAWELVGTVLILLLLATVSGWLLARWTLRPIQRTAFAVKGISETNLSQRLPQLQTNDEIDELITVFNQLLSRLETSFETQKRFTADASHEIGTPLTTLRGQTEVALLRPRTPQEYESILSSNLDEIDRLTQIFSNLLMLSRGDIGEQQTTREIISVHQSVSEVFERFRPQARREGLELSLRSVPGLFVLGDRTAIEQVLSNLIQNAIAYTPRGGKITVRVFAPSDTMVCIEVKDTGIGIEEQDKERVFERFYRSRSARLRRSEGSGLGLSISSLFARSMNGDIGVISETGKGSSFVFRLPLIKHSAEG